MTACEVVVKVEPAREQASGGSKVMPKATAPVSAKPKKPSEDAEKPSSQPTPTEKPKDEKTLLIEFLKSELIPQKGLAGREIEDWQGVVSYYIEDFNKSGKQKMLVIEVNPIDNEHYVSLLLYGLDGQKSILYDTVELQPDAESALRSIVVSQNEEEWFIGMETREFYDPELGFPHYDAYSVGDKGFEVAMYLSSDSDIDFGNSYVKKNGEVIFERGNFEATDEEIAVAINNELALFGLSKDSFSEPAGTFDNIIRLCDIRGDYDSSHRYVWAIQDYTGTKDIETSDIETSQSIEPDKEEYIPLMTDNLVEVYYPAGGHYPYCDYLIKYTNNRGELIDKKLAYGAGYGYDLDIKEDEDILKLYGKGFKKGTLEPESLDYDNDGIVEFIIGNAIPPFSDGFEPYINWMSVCEIDSETGELINKSLEHKDFYDNILIPRYENELNSWTGDTGQGLYYNAIYYATKRFVDSDFEPKMKTNTKKVEDIYWIDTDSIAALMREYFEIT